MFKLFAWIILLLPICGIAQNEFHGVLVDDESGNPVSRAHVKVLQTSQLAVSKQNGAFQLALDPAKEYDLEISHTAYETKVYHLSPHSWKDSGIRQIEMHFMVNVLPAAILTGAPDTVYGSKEYHVADFCFFKEGMLLLTYQNEKHLRKAEEQSKEIFEGCRLVWLDRFKNEVTTHNLDDQLYGFERDYLDLPVLKGKTGMWLIDGRSNQLYVERISEEDFAQHFEPVIDTLGGLLYATTYNPDFPAFEYYAYNLQDSTYHTLRYIIDQPLMVQFRSEYKWLHPKDKLEAFRYELATGIDKEIVGAYMSGFQSSPYYESLYAPMFVHKDSILIFDHYSDKLLKYNSMNELIDSVEINYHKESRGKDWSQKLVQDFNTGDMYSVHNRKGYTYLRQVDTRTGEIVSDFKLTHRYPENVKVWNGKVYYVYRPFESSQKKFLYSEIIQSDSIP